MLLEYSPTLDVLPDNRTMPEKEKIYRIFLSAAEPSADVHCAGLIAAVKKVRSNVEFVGVGGPKMAAQGCRLLETTVDNAAMIYNAFGQVFHYFMLIRRISNFFKTEQIDLAVVCDSPAFNFHVARIAKNRGIKTVFFVAPQLWAWAQWRIRKLRRLCDKLICLLPFEKDWFVERGVDAVFVGNPLLDGLSDDLSRYRKQYLDFDSWNASIAIMPGSRPAEINSLWGPMQQVALALRRKHPNLTFTAVAVDDNGKEVLKSLQILSFKCQYTVGSVSSTAAQSDFAIVASGSATLQVAAVGCPMVIMYQTSRVLWHLVGRWLVKTRFLSLVNILAERELVPEFMPYFSSIEPIIQSIEQLLAERDRLAQISGELIKIAKPMKDTNISGKAADIVIGMLNAAG